MDVTDKKYLKYKLTSKAASSDTRGKWG